MGGSTELVTIGEAAARLGLATSALRYYEERGLVIPATRRSGHRMYGPEQLRRLAFIQLMQQLGTSLDVVAVVLDGPTDQWRAAVTGQVDRLETLLTRLSEAHHYLQHILLCPTEHPVQECPVLMTLLDQRLAGASFEDLAEEEAGAVARGDLDDHAGHTP